MAETKAGSLQVWHGAYFRSLAFAVGVVKTIADHRKSPGSSLREWKAFAVFSGLGLQLLVNMLVFGYLGHLLAVRWHHAWITALGVLAGLGVGVYGVSYLIKRMLGDKS